ncbi:hypothetical protein GALMADRAFT_258436 [Galerina marginata CBS 339.88]|uniref:Uncharacterized protein n=1 Tax=Galerina marginata (strain CBS 339.88) TaxID=685588 RepID=A0A067S8W1_GALM3|nr:hypothetical protein GALMADRAFT_258436 [Galerina marginata CBS 339.88]
MSYSLGFACFSILVLPRLFSFLFFISFRMWTLVLPSKRQIDDPKYEGDACHH